MFKSPSNRNFFGRFKERVRSADDRDPGGRYFAILLEQLFYENPERVRHILFQNSRRSDFVGARILSNTFEYRLGRKADLAFLDTEDRVIGLVEIKEEDQLGPGAGDQVRDYLSFVQQMSEHTKVNFAYVTKHLPSNESMIALELHKVKPIFYRDLYEQLKKTLTSSAKRASSAVAQLFCLYLEEEGIVYQTLGSDDEKTLRLLLRLGLSVQGSTGFGKLKTAERVGLTPKLLSALLANVEAMGIEFHQRFRRHLSKAAFMPNFGFYPSWYISDVKKELTDPGEEWDETQSFDIELCDGGYLTVWSEGLLKGNTSCWIWVGYEFYLSKQVQRLEKYLYAGVGSNKFDYWDMKPFKRFPNQGAAQIGVRELIREQIERVVADGGVMSGAKQLARLLTDLKSG